MRLLAKKIRKSKRLLNYATLSLNGHASGSKWELILLKSVSLKMLNEHWQSWNSRMRCCVCLVWSSSSSFICLPVCLKLRWWTWSLEAWLSCRQKTLLVVPPSSSPSPWASDDKYYSIFCLQRMSGRVFTCVYVMTVHLVPQRWSLFDFYLFLSDTQYSPVNTYHRSLGASVCCCVGPNSPPVAISFPSSSPTALEYFSDQIITI